MRGCSLALSWWLHNQPWKNCAECADRSSQPLPSSLPVWVCMFFAGVRKASNLHCGHLLKSEWGCGNWHLCTQIQFSHGFGLQCDASWKKKGKCLVCTQLSCQYLKWTSWHLFISWFKLLPNKSTCPDSFFILSFISGNKMGCYAKCSKICCFLLPTSELLCDVTVRKHGLEKSSNVLTWLVGVMIRNHFCCPTNFGHQCWVWGNKRFQCVCTVACCRSSCCFTTWCLNFTVECYKCWVEIRHRGGTRPELLRESSFFLHWTKGGKTETKWGHGIQQTTQL